MKLVAVLVLTPSVVCLALAIVGTAMLRHVLEQRRAPYSPIIAPSVVERASLVWLFQLGRALCAPREWPLGLCYALELLAGHDSVLAIPEDEMEREVRGAWERLRRESELGLRRLAQEQRAEAEAEADEARRRLPRRTSNSRKKKEKPGVPAHGGTRGRRQARRR